MRIIPSIPRHPQCFLWRVLSTDLSPKHHLVHRLGIERNQSILHFGLNQRKQLLKGLLGAIMLVEPKPLGLDIQLDSYIHKRVVHLLLQLHNFLLFLLMLQLLILLLADYEL